MFRWLFPEQGLYLDRFAGFVDADAGQSIDFGATYLTEGAGAAACSSSSGEEELRSMV